MMGTLTVELVLSQVFQSPLQMLFLQETLALLVLQEQGFKKLQRLLTA